MKYSYAGNQNVWLESGWNTLRVLMFGKVKVSYRLVFQDGWKYDDVLSPYNNLWLFSNTNGGWIEAMPPENYTQQWAIRRFPEKNIPSCQPLFRFLCCIRDWIRMYATSDAPWRRKEKNLAQSWYILSLKLPKHNRWIWCIRRLLQ